MTGIYQIKLSEFELGQVLDGLEVRARAWGDTAIYFATGAAPPGVMVEECIGQEEAERMASCYQSLIAKILEQREAQS